MNPKDAKSVLMAYVDGVLEGRPRAEFNQLRIVNDRKGQAAMMKRLRFEGAKTVEARRAS